MIRFANLNDVSDIMNFIHNEWQNNHILSRDKSFFLYEFQYRDEINFVVSVDDDKQINGVLGFIPSAFGEDIDVCTVMWKVKKKSSDPILGVMLLEFLTDSNKFRTVMSVGINKKTVGIYKFLNLYTDHLKHYVLINQSIKNFKIAAISKVLQKKSFHSTQDFKLIILTRNFNFDFSKHADNVLYKDVTYFKKRYFDHPIYRYKVFGIEYDKKVTSLIVTRIQQAEQSKILRIVDFIGNECELKYISKFLYQYLQENDLEYADFYCFGLSPASLIDSGFIEINQDSNEVIIPNYFSPFKRENIKINFFAETKYLEHLKLFKADGDQDRPN